MKRVIARGDRYINALWTEWYVLDQCDKSEECSSVPILTWLNGGFLVFPLCPLLFISTDGVSATTHVSTGPMVYTWGVALPATYVDAFELHNIVGAYTLAVESSNSQCGCDRVTKALISLSGVTDVSLNVFMKKVGKVETFMQIQEASPLSVRIKEIPTQYLHTAMMAVTTHERGDVKRQGEAT